MNEVFSGSLRSGNGHARRALALLIAILAFLVFSCATKLPAIPESISSAEIIQKAQERSDSNDWKGAKYYYETLLERFPNEPNLVITAMYELAFIEYKQGNKAQAIAGFKAVVAKYSVEGGQSLPATWKILAQNLLAKLEPTPLPAKP